MQFIKDTVRITLSFLILYVLWYISAFACFPQTRHVAKAETCLKEASEASGCSTVSINYSIDPLDEKQR
jgi:hypothetical protein